MEAYGRNLRWVQNRQYDDSISTIICIPSCGHNRGQRRRRYERPFKKSARQYAKAEIRKEFAY